MVTDSTVLFLAFCCNIVATRHSCFTS